MRKFVLPAAVVAAAVAVIVLLLYTVANHSDTASIDSQVARHDFPTAPDYRAQLPLLGTDRSMSLASFRGKLLLVNIYASWCDPCQAEAPLLAREQKVLAAHGATIVGVTWQNASSAAEQFDRRYGLRYPVLRDVSGDFAHDFGTYQVPESFVINPQGKIVALERQVLNQKWLDQHVQPLLKDASS